MGLAKQAVGILLRLSQEYSYGNDILSTSPHNILTIADNTRLLQVFTQDKNDPIRKLSQDIKYDFIGCIKYITTPSYKDDTPHSRARMSSRTGWKTETTWNWLLQIMLALNLLPDGHLLVKKYQQDRHLMGLHTLYNLILIESDLTIQQRRTAWLLLGQEEIPDLYAPLMCTHFDDTARGTLLAMAAILEGHTQAVSRVGRDGTSSEEAIYSSLSLLDTMCPLGWKRDREAVGNMPIWIHETTGAGQRDFPNIISLDVITLHGQPLCPSTMEDWNSTAVKSWAPINSNMETLLHILLQQHPLGSLAEFRNNTMVVLQQQSPQGKPLEPHLFNCGDTDSEKKRRKISHLICRATSLTEPIRTSRTRCTAYSYPCLDPANHQHTRSGTTQRLVPLNDLVQSTSFTLTIYAIPYPQGHAGLRTGGLFLTPPAATPFMLNEMDTRPVYRMMHRGISENLIRRNRTERLEEASRTPGVSVEGTARGETASPPDVRRVFASSHGMAEGPSLWQRVILIQDGKDKGFIQAPVRSAAGSARATHHKNYKGHVLDLQIDTCQDESVGSAVHKTLLECYPDGSGVPSPDTIHYTLGDFPHGLFWDQGVASEGLLDTDIPVVEELVLQHTDKIDWIKEEHTTILHSFLSPALT